MVCSDSYKPQIYLYAPLMDQLQIPGAGGGLIRVPLRDRFEKKLKTTYLIDHGKNTTTQRESRCEKKNCKS